MFCSRIILVSALIASVLIGGNYWPKLARKAVTGPLDKYISVLNKISDTGAFSKTEDNNNQQEGTIINRIRQKRRRRTTESRNKIRQRTTETKIVKNKAQSSIIIKSKRKPKPKRM